MPSPLLFAIAFGRTYLDGLFQTCLPSLLAGYSGEPLDLRVFTLAQHYEEVSQGLGVMREAYGLNDAQVFVLTGEQPPNHRALIVALSFCAVKSIAEQQRTFISAFPDLVYARGTLQNALDLHKLTGQVVATFNGRTSGTCLEAMPAAISARELWSHFKRHRDVFWQNHTSVALNPSGAIPGHLIHDKGQMGENGGRDLVWCSSPNPFVGQFRPEDTRHFAQGGIKAWDHAWVTALHNTGRLCIMHDLASGFTVEPLEKGTAYEEIPLPPDAARVHKFATERCWQFVAP